MKYFGMDIYSVPGAGAALQDQAYILTSSFCK